jgi:ring-1,2-phenylacetyl-CoA epoxidase subunit PaaE
MFRDELEAQKSRYPDRFQLVNVLSREPQDTKLLSGRLDRDRLERILDALVVVPSVDEWYLCGPSGLVDQARGLLADLGADNRHVHHEVFHEDSPNAPTRQT